MFPKGGTYWSCLLGWWTGLDYPSLNLWGNIPLMGQQTILSYATNPTLDKCDLIVSGLYPLSASHSPKLVKVVAGTGHFQFGTWSAAKEKNLYRMHYIGAWLKLQSFFSLLCWVQLQSFGQEWWKKAHPLWVPCCCGHWPDTWRWDKESQPVILRWDVFSLDWYIAGQEE